MNDYKLVPVEMIKRAAGALERFAYDTLAGRNSAHELRELLTEVPAINIVATKNEQGQIVSVTLQDEDHSILQVIAEADVQGEPVGRVNTVGGYPDESEHTIEWLCKYKDLKDGDLLYSSPQPADQKPEVLAEGYFHPLPDENDYEFHNEENFPNGSDCPVCVPAVILRKSAVANQLSPDVSGLVNLLEQLLTSGHLPIVWKDRVIEALAAHRKGGN